MFRFSIRELLMLATIVGLVVGWWLDHRTNAIHARRSAKWQHRAEFAAEVVRTQGGTIDWGEDVDQHEGVSATYTPVR